MFRELVREYATEGSDGVGETLDFLLDDGWQVFDDRLIESDPQKRSELLLAILEHGLHPKDDFDEPDYRQVFALRECSAVDLEGRWEDKLNAMFSGQPDSKSNREEPIEQLGDDPKSFDFIADAVESAGLVFTIRRPHFRARIHTDRSSSDLIPLAKMGAPPPEKARAARANRAGQPVLYLASDEQTALAEARSWKGAVVAIARMGLAHPLRILNLAKLPAVGSPFEIEHLAWLLDAWALFRRFGRELSRPIIPGEEDSEYGPSQHITDVVRKAGFDGIAYPSAMGLGHNVVLFDTGAAIPESVTYYRVGRPRFEVDPYPFPEMRWEEVG